MAALSCPSSCFRSALNGQLLERTWWQRGPEERHGGAFPNSRVDSDESEKHQEVLHCH